MRKFKLINSVGAEYSLNTSASFLHDPQGLGYEYDNKYLGAGEQFIQTTSALKQKEPEGKISFESYSEFNDFVKFAQYKPLTLAYTPDTKTFYLSVNIKELKKTELGENKLDCDIRFEALGQWYKLVRWETSDREGKTYDYTYSFEYSDSASGTMLYESESVLKSPIKITIFGDCVNPRWIHRVNGVVVAEGKVNKTVAKGERLVISSVVPYQISLQDNKGQEIENCYQFSDFSTERFLFLGLGTNRITFSHEGTAPINVAVKAYEYFESI